MLLDALAGRMTVLKEPVDEAHEILAALLDVPRHWPKLHADDRVEGDVWRRACIAADRRAVGAPVQYAVGRASFRKLTLDVDERVLIPRPETELLVDLVLQRCTHGTVADVGTGSGAIAVALASEGAYEHVLATDISSDALDVARANAARYAGVTKAEMTFVHADLLLSAAVRHPLSAVVSNPPYISYNEIDDLPAAVRDWEPAMALFSPDDGMATTRRLVQQAAGRLVAGGLLALEVDARRASLVAELVATDDRYERVSVQLDLAGRERFVLATRREQP
jgi:release factor glutamine methyltransferase